MVDIRQIVDSMEENWIYLVTHWMHYSKSMVVEEKEDIRIFVCPGVYDSTFNFVLRARFRPENVEKRVLETLSIFRENKLPLSWYIGPKDTPSNLPEMLVKSGLVCVDENVGMFLEIKSFVYKPQQKVKFQRVLTSAQLQDFDLVNIKSGESPHFDLLFKDLPSSVYGEGSPIEFYVGYVDGVPIVSGILVLYAGVAGIYYIATVPEERRKGYAIAIMGMLFERALKLGYDIATLQATEDGKHLYRKLGFLECCHFAEYNEKAF